MLARRRFSFVRVGAAALLAALLAPPAATLLAQAPPTAPPPPPPPPAKERAPEPARTETRWYTVQIQGKRAGRMMSSVERQGPRVVTRSDLEVKLKRDGADTAIRVQTEFVETADGKPMSMSSTTLLGSMPTTTNTTFTPAGLRVVTQQAGTTKEQTLPLPEGDWMTPAAADRFIAAKVRDRAMEIVTRTIDPSGGPVPGTTTWKQLGRVSLPSGGRAVDAIKWSSTTDQAPGVESVEYTDEQGKTLRSETQIGGLKMVLTLADAAAAQRDIDAPELLVSTMITPTGAPIAAARSSTRGVYLVKSSGAMPEPPTAASQTVERAEGGARVTVSVGRTSVPTEDELADKELAAPSAMIGSDDERVRALAQEALKGAGPDQPARAEALRRFVHAHVNDKNFDVGFASAAEVARTRAGDCTEHAVLLCAMLRAGGMPARLASGVVYVEGAGAKRGRFGHHLWTQAIVNTPDGPRWVDLDAALSATRPTDATHIALATLSLADGSMTGSMAGVAAVIGTLSIEVEECK